MGKIINHYASAIFCSLLFFIIALAKAQPAPNKYGLIVITKNSDYKATVAKDPNKEMFDVMNIPVISVELAYMKRNNFMQTALYLNTKTTFLRKPVLQALAEVQRELRSKGLSLKIWDAYRPYSVTEKMWERVRDSRYVADPSKGSGHNRGISVDLTIINHNSKQELNMGTGFDNFSDTAHFDFKGLSEEVLANRRLLRSVMERHGFIPLESEWWHYFIKDGNHYELLDLSFKQLSKLNKRTRVQ